MKKLLLLTIFCAFAVISKAQNTYPWPSSGNIGIGTTTPSYKLEITGGTGWRGQMGNGSTGQYAEIIPYEIATDNNAGWSGTMLGIRTSGFNSSAVPLTQNIWANNSKYQQAWAMTFGSDKDQTNGPSLSVWTGDAINPGTVMTEIFKIKSNGNVGVNSLNPLYKLDIFNQGTGSALNISGLAIGTRNDVGIDFSAANGSIVNYARIGLQITT